MTFKMPELNTPKEKLGAIVIIVAVLLVMATRLAPHYALAVGLLLGVSFGNILNSITRPLTKYLLQLCVVGLGFGMDFMKVVEAGSTGFLFTVCTIVGAMLLGLLLGKLLNTPKRISYLISAGTAICGGSAIAAIAPVMKAEEKEISMALATVFTLNAIALLTFPFIGQFFHLTQEQFGLWSAISIHDTSSVVGASTAYGNEALTIATTVKLARALWIIPLVILTSFLYGKKAGLKSFPVFILGFICASLFKTYVNLPEEFYTNIVTDSRTGLSVTLLLLGTGISLKSIKEVGLSALVNGILLWLILAVSTLISVIYF